MIFLQASRCSTLIKRLVGAVSDANSSIFPTSDQPISVVLVSSGCKANRISGTESAAPITTVPNPSSTPRNERRLTESSSREIVGASPASFIGQTSAIKNERALQSALDYFPQKCVAARRAQILRSPSERE